MAELMGVGLLIAVLQSPYHPRHYPYTQYLMFFAAHSLIKKRSQAEKMQIKMCIIASEMRQMTHCGVCLVWSEDWR